MKRKKEDGVDTPFSFFNCQLMEIDISKEEPTLEVEQISISPNVNLVITGIDGEVRYLAEVGSSPLADVLKTASMLADFPVDKQEHQLDDIGQDIFVITDFKYFRVLCGTFTSLSWDSIKSLSSTFSKDNLNYTFVVNY